MGKETSRCPQCGFTFDFDGIRCGHCGYGKKVGFLARLLNWIVPENTDEFAEMQDQTHRDISSKEKPQDEHTADTYMEKERSCNEQLLDAAIDGGMNKIGLLLEAVEEQKARAEEKRINDLLSGVLDPSRHRLGFCPICQSDVREKARQCLVCSYAWHRCPKCAAEWERGSEFCKQCEHNLYDIDPSDRERFIAKIANMEKERSCNEQPLSVQKGEYVKDCFVFRYPLGVNKHPEVHAEINSYLTKIILSSKCKRLIIDLAQNKFMLSSELGLLERVRREAVTRGINLILVNLHKKIRQLFEITHMDSIFTICDSLESVLGIQEKEREQNDLVDSLPGIPYKLQDFIAGKYEVLGIKNKGGMGVIYLARNHSNGMTNVLKTFRDEFLDSENAKERFLAEARAWLGLGRHPNIVPALSVFEYDDRPYLEMEYVPPSMEGAVTLREYMNDSACIEYYFNETQFATWGIHFCLAMEHAQSRGIICHRDIKPENLLLDRIEDYYRLDDGIKVLCAQRRVLKLTDFGLSKSLDRIVPFKVSSIPLEKYQHGKTLCTLEGTGCGTPAYMPPEQFDNAASANIRNDIYSFGIVLYEIIAGKHPYLSDTESYDDQIPFGEYMHTLHLTKTAEPVDSAMWPIIEKCIAKEPAKRFQDIRELRNAFEGLPHW